MVLSNSELHGKAPCLSGSLEPCWSWCLNSWLAKVLPRWCFTVQSSSWVLIVNIVLTTSLGMLYRYILPSCTGFLVSFRVATSFHCENQGQLRDAPSGSLCPPDCSCSLPALLPLTSGSTGLQLEMHGHSCALEFLLVYPQLASVKFDSDKESLISRKVSPFWLLFFT